MRTFILCTAAAAAAIPVSGLQAATDDRERTRPLDPNERICENIIVTGSRIASRRFCGTRAEWQEKRRLDRQMIDEIQRSVCVVQKSGGNVNSCSPI